MANEWIIKDYNGGAIGTTLAGALGGAAMSLVVTSGAGLPEGSGGPFVVVVDRGIATEEKLLVASRSANTLTITVRGYDNTLAQAHANLATLEHCMDAHTLKQANALSAIMDTAGSMAFRGSGFSYTKLALGTAGLPVVAGASTPQYSALTEAGLIAAVVEKLAPAASVMMTVAATPDTGYLFIDGSSVINAQTLFPTTWGRVPAAWKSGSTMVFPDWRGRTPVNAGTGAGLTARALAAVFGNETHQLSSAESGVATHAHTTPAHSHSINHDHAAANLTANGYSVVVQIIGTAGGAVFTSAGPHTATNLTTESLAVDLPNFAGSSGTAAPTTDVAAGASAAAAHNNMQPSFAVNFQIKMH